MSENDRNGAAVAEDVAVALDDIDDLCDTMSKIEYAGPDDDGGDKQSRRFEIHRRGFRAYIKDLPRLLEERREGHMIAYLGDDVVGLAETDEELQESLIREPRFARKIKDIFVTRIIQNDIEDYAKAR